MIDFHDEPPDDWLPGPQISREDFLRWRNARRGTTSAERLTNPVWDWLIRTRISAYQANDHFRGPTSFGGQPGWCFRRFGRTVTDLPDGRRIAIAGEHEDHYDPDFYIYNDVVVCHPDDSIEVYGYPASEFPPTDFHTATLRDETLLLIGNLGYPNDRRVGETQVLSLDLKSRRVRRISTTGDRPGWISSHSAESTDDGIVVRGGERCVENGIYENIDDWRLDPESMQWTRLTDRRWPRFEFSRVDGEPIDLWEKRSTSMWRQLARTKQLDDVAAELQRLANPADQSEWTSFPWAVAELQRLSNTADPPTAEEAEVLANLYRPSVPHEVVARDAEADEFRVYRILIDGVCVRFNEDFHTVRLTIEGDLPQEVTNLLVEEMRSKLSRIERVGFNVEQRG
jgi:hypothetical protein